MVKCGGCRDDEWCWRFCRQDDASTCDAADGDDDEVTLAERELATLPDLDPQHPTAAVRSNALGQIYEGYINCFRFNYLCANKPII